MTRKTRERGATRCLANHSPETCGIAHGPLDALNCQGCNLRVQTQPRLPRYWKRLAADEVACPHRDLSVCPACTVVHPECVEVFGRFYWVPDARERELLEDKVDEARDHLPATTLIWDVVSDFGGR